MAKPVTEAPAANSRPQTDRTYRCSCGAAGSDPGELADHILDMLKDPEDEREHQWRGPGDEPERVTELRDRMARREQLRAQLAEAAGMSVDELREVLR